MRHRADSNQAEIIAAAEGIGATVIVLSQVGRGCPDILCGFRNHNLLIEIKTDDGQLRPEQRKFAASWSGQVTVIRNAQQMIELLEMLE